MASRPILSIRCKINRHSSESQTFREVGAAPSVLVATLISGIVLSRRPLNNWRSNPDSPFLVCSQLIAQSTYHLNLAPLSPIKHNQTNQPQS